MNPLTQNLSSLNDEKTMYRIMTLAAAGILMAACSGDAPETHGAPLDPVEVQVTSAWQSAGPDAFPAQVMPVQEAEVATRMAGTLDEVAVQVGDRVRAGDLLARLDGSDVEARIGAARAQATLARRTFERVERLAADGAASQQELDQAEAALRGAEAMVAEAEAQAAYVEIRAPLAGVVTRRMADPGDLAAPGIPLVQLSSDAVKVVAELPAEMVGAVAAGQTVTLVTDGGVLEGTVRSAVPALSRASRRFQVEVTPAPGTRLLPGAFVRLEMKSSDASTQWIPADAVVRRGQLTGVFALETDTLRLRWLRLGEAEGEAVEVLSGPAGELTVVRSPEAGLQDGQPVSRATTLPGGGADLATDRED